MELSASFCYELKATVISYFAASFHLIEPGVM